MGPDSFDRIIQENPALTARYQNMVEAIPKEARRDMKIANGLMIVCSISIVAMWVWAAIKLWKKGHVELFTPALLSVVFGFFFMMFVGIYYGGRTELRNPEVTAKNRIVDFLKPTPTK